MGLLDAGGGGGGTGDGSTDDGSTDNGSTDDSSTDGGSTDGSSGGSSGGGFTLPSVLSTFASDPRRFVVGAVLATIVEGVFGVVEVVIDTILLILGGSEPTTFNAPGEQLGLADIPVVFADALGGAGSTAGSAIIAGVESANEPIFALASALGPFAPAVIVGVVILETIAVLWILQRAVFVAADLLQLGGLTE